MIGHAMPAAGIAGLDQDRPRPLPSRSSADVARRAATPAARSRRIRPFKLNPAARPWIHAEPRSPRRAGVNAFGFAGINAHAVLEEHTPSADGDAPGACEPGIQKPSCSPHPIVPA